MLKVKWISNSFIKNLLEYSLIKAKKEWNYNQWYSLIINGSAKTVSVHVIFTISTPIWLTVIKKSITRKLLKN